MKCVFLIHKQKQSLTKKYGEINQNTNITASTVYEALVGENGLIDILNNYQKSVYPDMPNVFKMEFINDIDQDFKLSKLANPEEENKTTAPMSNATTTEQVNEKTARSALPDLSKVVINLPAGINILTAIEKIVFKSTFLTAALKNVTVSQFENDPKTDAPEDRKSTRLNSSH